MAVPIDLSKIVLKEYFFLELAVLNNAPETIQTPVPMGNVSVERLMATGFAAEESFIEVALKFVVTPHDADQNPLPVQGRFHLVMRFTVIDLAEQLKGSFGLEGLRPGQELVYTVVGLAYSTARGLLLDRTRDTVLNGFSLPAVDVRNLTWNLGKPPVGILP